MKLTPTRTTCQTNLQTCSILHRLSLLSARLPTDECTSMLEVSDERCKCDEHASGFGCAKIRPSIIYYRQRACHTHSNQSPAQVELLTFQWVIVLQSKTSLRTFRQTHGKVSADVFRSRDRPNYWGLGRSSTLGRRLRCPIEVHTARLNVWQQVADDCTPWAHTSCGRLWAGCCACVFTKAVAAAWLTADEVVGGVWVLRTWFSC